SVVPDLPAAGFEPRPPRYSLTGPRRRSVTWYASSGETTRTRGPPGAKDSRTWPLGAVTLSTACALTRYPPLSNALYAARCSTIDSGSWPSVVATPAGFSSCAVTPSRCMKSSTRWPPSDAYVQSAGRLRDCASAVRSVIHPSCLPSQSLNVWPPMVLTWSSSSDAGVTSPASSAAAYVYTLNDDPTPRQPSVSTPVRLTWPRIAALL